MIATRNESSTRSLHVAALAIIADKMATADHQDEYMRKLLRKKGNTEALKWLESAPEGVHRGLGEHSHEEAIESVRKLYKLGAEQVMAIDIKRNGPIEACNTLVVALPTNPAKRRLLFHFISRMGRGLEFDPNVDRGQTHLLSLWK